MFDAELFLQVVRRLEGAGALASLCLIGSWAQVVYRENLDPTIPGARTNDLDFLVSRPLAVPPGHIDIPAILAQMGFQLDISYGSGAEKYRREDLDVEFLSAVRRGPDPTPIPALNIRAHQIGGIEYLEQNIVRMPFREHQIRVPHPAAFAWHKLYVSTQRKEEAKALKDREAGREVLTVCVRVYGQTVVDEFLERMPRKMRSAARSVFAELNQ